MRIRGLVNSLATAAVLSFLFPLGAPAATIFFSDLSDTVTFSTDIPSGVSGSCTGEYCTVTVLSPGGTASGFFTIFELDWTEPGQPFVVSDRFCLVLCAVSASAQSATIDFASDDETPLLFGSGTPEDGTIQTALTINWLDVAGNLIGTVDVKFQSDVSEVPEPSSALLMLTGLAVLGIPVLRRRRNPRAAPTS